MAAFASVPNSMFMTAIFMGGEWAQVDFTPSGKVLAGIMCLVTINIFAIPSGLFSAAFEQAALAKTRQQRRLERG
jgi:hypothetical protein